jgi:Kdo2-lipid IVA lauroyltransferase/acyltransferase
MYYIIYPFFYLISLLPLRVLYLLSDCIYGLIFYVFKYRKKIVKANLRLAFPEKSEQEILVIAKKFYKNFIDSLIETIKLFSKGSSFIKKHCIGDLSICDDLFAKGKSFQLHACHQFNWEYINHYFSMTIPQTTLGVYMPLSNKALERIFLNMRQRYNTVMLPATNMKNKFNEWREKPHMLVLVADQNPGSREGSYWFKFFNKLTPFIIGPEKYAREKGQPVVFAKSIKLKRGYYKVEFELICEDASTLPEGELTRKFVNFITKVIKDQPENWLWSHKRFKWDYNDEYKNMLKDPL